MVRGVGRARGVVGEPGLLRSDRVQHADSRDGVVGHVLVEKVLLVVVRRFDGLDVLEDSRGPLAGVAADEAVEVLKTQPGRPEIERTGLAGMPVGDVVVLAVPGGVVTVLPEHLGEGPAALGHERVVAWEAGAGLHDGAGGARMVVAPGQQAGARGRTECAGMELRVAQAVLGEPVEGWGRNWSAEGARGAEAHVVGKDQQDIRCALRCLHLLREILDRVLGRAADCAAERLLRRRQHRVAPERGSRCFLGRLLCL